MYVGTSWVSGFSAPRLRFAPDRIVDRCQDLAPLFPDTLYETTNVDGLDRQCSGGVYPRLNGGYCRFSQTNRLSEFISDSRQVPGGDKPRHYTSSAEEQVKKNCDLGHLFSKSRLNLRQAQVSKPLPQSNSSVIDR